MTMLKYAFLVVLCSAGFCSAKPAKLMLLTGQNNHDWRTTAPMVENILKGSGTFEVTVVTTPPASADPDVQKAFDPDFSSYDAVVLHWNDFGVKNPVLPGWMDKLIAYVEAGGGLIVHHAGGLEHHPKFPEIAGLVWQKPGFGERMTLDDSGKEVRVTKGQGQGSGHGKRYAAQMQMWNVDDPICQGFPQKWMHTEDEVWFGLRGPAEGMKILVTANPPQTNLNEPIVWTRQQGKGRVFVSRLGHDAVAMNCTGFRTIMTRGCEWAATGKVSLPVPPGFPTADKTSPAEPPAAGPTNPPASAKQ